MNVQFTGTVSKNRELWNSLLDGEHIILDKKKNFINMYAAFDIYYIKGEDVRGKGFVPLTSEDVETDFRLPLLQLVIVNLNVLSYVNPKAPVPLKITAKNFQLGTKTKSIFQCCAAIIKKEADGLFEYETDGLIFTPASYGVGADKIGVYTKPYKTTWKYSFKWKPVQFNTIDFLVTLKKNANGTDFIGNVFENGTDAKALMQIPEYKTAILRVGFDESRDGYLNPYQDTLDDKLTAYDGDKTDKPDNYLPTQFFPTNPSDNKAGICNLRLRQDVGADKHMYTEDNQIIEDNTIVEFRYEKNNEEHWRWIPLRIRYDKTAQFRDGEKMFGNDYRTANSNWHSIHNPITRNMIISGENIPDELADDDVYYNKVSGVTKTRGLRDFHNLYVKKSLINAVAKPGATLIDLAVGKGGDFPKWIDAKLKFVFGVDLSRDNIQNRMNGAYARYLNYRKDFKVMPSALFVNGNSSVNIRSTKGILIDKDKVITRAVFGQGPKDAKILGEGVFKQYGVAAEGFDVCSIQFAVHYMFENQETLQNFLQNVSEVTKEGGYFIGTSYDGEKIFNMLKNVPVNQSKSLLVNKDSENEQAGDKKKIWEITKRYDRDEFTDDSTCVGYAIDVYQETINKTIREYLVNYSYLTRVLENYGFVPVTPEELKKMHSSLPSSSALFSDLFNKMNQEIQNTPRAKMSYGIAPSMSPEERTISFLNRYFIYKKVRKVSDAEKVSLDLQKKTMEEEIAEEDATLRVQQTVRKEMNRPEEHQHTAAATAEGTKKTKKITVAKTKEKTAKTTATGTAKETATAGVEKATKPKTKKTKLSAIAEETAPAEQPQQQEQQTAAEPVEKATVKKLNRTLKLKK
jgi:SAM-dependent methyltransferase